MTEYLLEAGGQSECLHEEGVLDRLLWLAVAHDHSASIWVLLISGTDPAQAVPLRKANHRPAVRKVLAYLEQHLYLAWQLGDVSVVYVLVEYTAATALSAAWTANMKRAHERQTSPVEEYERVCYQLEVWPDPAFQRLAFHLA